MFHHPKLGLVSVPQPFWVVRILALRKRCEHEACAGTATVSELTALPRNPLGAMNPMNLMITCFDHDPLGTDRLIPRKYFDNLRE